MSTPHICPTCQCEGSHASMLACVEALQTRLAAAYHKAEWALSEGYRRGVNSLCDCHQHCGVACEVTHHSDCEATP